MLKPVRVGSEKGQPCKNEFEIWSLESYLLIAQKLSPTKLYSILFMVRAQASPMKPLETFLGSLLKELLREAEEAAEQRGNRRVIMRDSTQFVRTLLGVQTAWEEEGRKGTGGGGGGGLRGEGCS